MSKNTKSYQAPTHDEIAICAQGIYEREGRPQGRATQHWLQAESQLVAERKAAAGESAAKPASKPAAPASAKPRGNDWQATGRQNLHTN